MFLTNFGSPKTALPPIVWTDSSLRNWNLNTMDTHIASAYVIITVLQYATLIISFTYSLNIFILDLAVIIWFLLRIR